MKVALTEEILKDTSKLPVGLEGKCLDLLSSLRKIDAKELQQKAVQGLPLCL
jgi:hypothetical protein